MNPNKGLYLGIDLGDVRTGVAISDENGMIATGVEVITEKVLGNVAKRVAQVAEQRRAGGIIIGLPLNMDGSEGDRCERVRFFASLLAKRCALPIIFRDERLTTVRGHEILSELGRDSKSRKGAIDMLSAELILRGFLDE